MEKRQPKDFPAQQQDINPGKETEMEPKPHYDNPLYKGSGKLLDKVALISGGDSGIGRSVATLYAREGADVAIVYLENHEDARITKQAVEKEGRRCLTISADLKSSKSCFDAVERTFKEFNRLDILVNNCAVQWEQNDFAAISEDQLETTFRTNFFSYWFMTQAALKYLKEGSSIINCTSVNAYKGHPGLIDYSCTKGAINVLTYSLALNLAERKIRVNGVAPGPIWTPLIPSSFGSEKVEKFGKEVPMKRAGQPEEVAPSFVFLASDVDSSYITGQILHPNGGMVVHA